MATNDWISLVAGVAAINANSTSGVNDSRVQQQITAISEIGDDLVGPVVQRTVTTELQAGGTPRIYLARRPVASITTVREVSTPGTIDTLTAVSWGAATSGYYAPAHEYTPTLKSGVLIRMNAGYEDCWPAGDNTVEVTYVAGRYATTALVGARYAEACEAALRRLWKREAGVWAQTPDFYGTEDPTPGSGFFRAVQPVLVELLADEVQHRVHVA